MKFGEMIERLEKRDVIVFARRHRQSKGDAVAYMPATIIAPEDVTPRTAAILDLIEHGENTTEPLQIDGYFVAYTSKGTWQPGWTPSQADMHAEDWEIVGG